MGERKVVNRNIVIAVAVLCVVLAISLVGAVANYSSILNGKDSQINDLNSAINNKDSQISDLQNQIASDKSTINSLNSQIANLQGQVASANSQISSLNSQVTTLQSQVSDLTAIINMSKSELKTLVFHVSEKGEGYTWGHIPDVNYTYNQITFNNTYNVLLKPEYKGNENWTETLAWLTANFGGVNGIPIMLDVFSGGDDPTPSLMLSTNDILAAMAACNVQWLAINEVVSWHIEHEQPFPTEYVTTIFNFCREHNLKAFWTEWKVDTFKAIQTYIAGFEDIVTVSFSTNSGDLEPADGFMLISTTFQHWGGSIQAWYWTTRYDSDPLNMPISLLIQHALSAKNIGTEVIQFEPYWYFFDNGEAKENLKLLETMLA
jgi:cell division protein FtsL